MNKIPVRPEPKTTGPNYTESRGDKWFTYTLAFVMVTMGILILAMAYVIVTRGGL